MSSAEGSDGQDVFESITAGDLASLRQQLERDPALLSKTDFDWDWDWDWRDFVSRESVWTPDSGLQRTPLQHAAALGQTDAVDLLIDLKAPLEGRNGNGDTALIAGARSNQPEVVRRLLRHGADHAAMDRGNRTALHSAAGRGHSEVVKELLAAGAPVSSPATDGRTPLHYASSSGRVECAQLLLAAGASPSKLTNASDSPQHDAVRNNQIEVVRLLAPLSNRDLVNKAGKTPLSMAERAGYQEVVAALFIAGGQVPREMSSGAESGGQDVFESIASGDLVGLRRQLERDPALLSKKDWVVLHWVEPGTPGHQTQRTPLQHAAALGQTDAVDLLVYLKSPLEGALLAGARSNQPEVVRRLIRHGADPAGIINDATQLTALHFVAEIGNSKVMKELLAAQAPVNSLDVWGKTPLHEASKHGRVECAQLLLAAGASPSIVDTSGYSPLHEAAMNNQPDVVRLLAPLSNMELVNNLGKTPLMIAKRYRCPVYDPQHQNNEWYPAVVFELLSMGARASDSQVQDILDWSISNGHSAVVQEFVKRGAVSWSKDSEGEGMTRLTSDTVEKLLNACIKVHKNKDESKNPTMAIEYPFLGPPQHLPKLPELPSCLTSRCTTTNCTCCCQPTSQDKLPEDPDNPNFPMNPLSTSTDNVESGASESPAVGPEAKPETKPLLALARSDTHKHLITHPVITSFLMWKWGRIKPYFYMNVIMFIMFFIFLHAYIFLSNKTRGQDGENITFKWITFALLLILTLKEFAQLWWALAKCGDCACACACAIPKCGAWLKSCKTHIANIENWLEYGLIVSTFMLLFPPNGFDIKTVTAISILLAWVELLFLVGNHPLVSIYRTMFTKVSWNFFKFLTWLFWFIFGTGLAFSFLLHYPKGEKNDKNEQKNEAFLTVWDSIFKTILMSLTGEIESGNIDFSTDFKKFFFVLFIFFMFLVLVNLLNGLAISDISIIQNESKITSLISRLEAIYLYEKVLLLPGISHGLRTLYNISYCIRRFKLSFKKDTYFLLSNSTKLKNKTAQIEIGSTNWTNDEDMDEDMDEDVEEAILDEAKAIYDQSSRTDENDDLRERINKIEEHMKETEKKRKEDVKSLEEKMDKILHAIMAAPPVGAEAAGAAGLPPGLQGGRP